MLGVCGCVVIVVACCCLLLFVVVVAVDVLCAPGPGTRACGFVMCDVRRGSVMRAPGAASWPHLRLRHRGRVVPTSKHSRRKSTDTTKSLNSDSKKHGTGMNGLMGAFHFRMRRLKSCIRSEASKSILSCRLRLPCSRPFQHPSTAEREMHLLSLRLSRCISHGDDSCSCHHRFAAAAAVYTPPCRGSCHHRCRRLVGTVRTKLEKQATKT